MTIKECYNKILSQILAFENEGEARAITLLVLESVEGVGKRELMLEPQRMVVNGEAIDKVVEQLSSGVPVQYIIGKEEFYGREFDVSPSVLIPRGETEELVRHTLQRCLQGKVLDIGTGSGAIAITLALECDALEVEACDISQQALSQAAHNAQKLGARVRLFHCDILSSDIDLGYSAIVSNPPYICDSERELMSPKVYDHEPLGALFVSDDDPLIFYRVIAQKALASLNSKGYLLFEINEAMGKETVAMLENMGYTNVELHKDLHAKDRMVIAQKM